MATLYPQADSKQLIYLYELPKSIVTSIKIAQIIKDKSGYDLPEPVQLRDCKPNPVTGLPSPFQMGIIKVDPNQWQNVANAIKYFTIDDGSVDEHTGEKQVWECRALPFDRDLLGANKNSTNTLLNVFVKGVTDSIPAAKLEQLFKESFGPVKSAKVSRSAQVKTQDVDGRKIKVTDLAAPPTSNGYGFVCFQNPEDVKKAVQIGNLNDLQIIKYQPKDHREARKIYNNIYVKDFPLSYTEQQLRDLFGKYGNITSCVVMKTQDKDGNEKPFAFICYSNPSDPTYGPECADKAVQELHGKEFDGHTLYVQPALPKAQRQAQVQREQTRFKNSKKKCNLFVKGFPNSYTPDDLRNLFAPHGDIESIKIIPSNEGQAKRAFICYKQPDQAASARQLLHGQMIDNKPLYVTNYELPEVRKKQQAEAKDRIDFMNYRKQTAAPLDSSILTRPDTIQLIQQILMLVQNKMNPRGPYNMQANGQRYNRPQGDNRRPPYQQRMNNPRQGAPVPQGYVQQPPMPIQAPPQVLPTQVAAPAIELHGVKHLQHPDPYINTYNMNGVKLIPAVVPENKERQKMVGEFIYQYVENLIGEGYAPKVTGMLIDLPLEEIKAYLYDFEKLVRKTQEAVAVLVQVQQQAQQQQQ